MRILYTFVLLLCTFIICYPQHYQPILPDTTVFFKNDVGVIKAIRIDTTYLSTSDKIYHNFNTIRNCSAASWQPNPKGASWLGEKVISQLNGTWIFFNQKLDSIFIKTLAAPGQSWRLLELDSGAYLEGTVSTITLEDVFGVNDSVKTILMQAKDNANNPISHSFNGRRIQIGKYLGFIEPLHFYEFPNDTMHYRISNKGVPTRYDVYNHEIGDKIQVRTLNGSAGCRRSYVFTHYLAKTYTQNSITYRVARETLEYLSPPWDCYEDTSAIHSMDTIDITYSNLNAPVLLYLPEEPYTGSSRIIPSLEDLWDYTLVDSSSICAGRKISIRNYGTGTTAQGDSCWPQAMDYYYYNIDVIEGLGIFENSGGVASGYIETLVYYQTAACTYGQLFTGIKSPTLDGKEFSLYPNPATDIVTVDFQTAIEKPISITIYDIAGKVIRTADVLQFPFRLSTASLKNGYYFVSIHSETDAIQKKLVVQR